MAKVATVSEKLKYPVRATIPRVASRSRATPNLLRTLTPVEKDRLLGAVMALRYASFLPASSLGRNNGGSVNDREPVFAAHGHIGDVGSIDHRRARAGLQPGEHSRDGGLLPFDFDLHRAVGKIAHIAHQPPVLGLA